MATSKKKTIDKMPSATKTGSLNNLVSDVSVAAQSVDAEELSKIEEAVHSFGEIRLDSLQDYLDWKKLFEQYEEIYRMIDKYVDEITEPEYFAIKEKIESFISELNFCNDKFMRNYNSWTAAKGKLIEDRTDKQQLLNFAIFSLFMTLLTFLLSNIVVLTKTDFSVKTIVVVNLILLLVASVVFLFIGLFFGFVKKSSTAGYVIKSVILSLLPILIIAALVLVSVLL